MNLIRSNIKLLIFLSILLSSLLSGCATQEDQTNASNTNFDHELYDGKSTLGLSGDFPPATPEEAMIRGDKAYLEKNTDLALYEYIRALSFPTQDKADQAYYKIGYIHQQRGNSELAKIAYSRAALIDENNIQYAASAGIMELKLGERDNAKQHLLRTIRMDQQRQGKADWDPNLDTFASQLSIDKSSPFSAYIALGIITDLDARHDQAQLIYRSCLRVDGKSRSALTNLGYSYYLSGDTRQAEIINKRATILYPDDKRAWSNLGLIYIRSKRYEDALDSLQHVMSPAEALNDIGYFSMLEGDYEASVNYLEQAINASPTYYAKAYQNLKRAKKLQITAPPVKLTNKWGNQQTQATVFSISERIDAE
ncbi:tetratricopeptide repeat protein [Photobacterium sp.]|uniref:tetratricopeptide repeat protein n=1 Tax=Photobacterium sp. TaxID=660 RepID=UPI00299CF861|nr:tetratricopeptide repeat protein [Photobacterium sp.]MDX1302226.1 tetratricopeptide repeat protein [Photobacterium sp.]